MDARCLPLEDRMAEIKIYTGLSCVHCTAAKMLLTSGAIYIRKDRSLSAEGAQRSGRTSVPQIFIKNQHIGDLDDLRRMDREETLMPLNRA